MIRIDGTDMVVQDQSGDDGEDMRGRRAQCESYIMLQRPSSSTVINQARRHDRVQYCELICPRQGLARATSGQDE